MDIFEYVRTYVLYPEVKPPFQSRIDTKLAVDFSLISFDGKSKQTLTQETNSKLMFPAAGAPSGTRRRWRLPLLAVAKNQLTSYQCDFGKVAWPLFVSIIAYLDWIDVSSWIELLIKLHKFGHMISALNLQL